MADDKRHYKTLSLHGLELDREQAYVSRKL